MRQLGCPIEYCKTQKTYYYTTEGGICLKFQQESLDNNELHKVLGGQRTTFFKKLLTYPKYGDRKSTRLNSSHYQPSRMPSSA